MLLSRKILLIATWPPSVEGKGLTTVLAELLHVVITIVEILRNHAIILAAASAQTKASPNEAQYLINFCQKSQRKSL
jgi:hypothetical protein